MRPAAGPGLRELVQEAPGKPRGGGPGPGRLHAEVAGLATTQGRAAGPREGRGPLRPPPGAPRLFPEPEARGAREQAGPGR